jgi:hypothetical protein
MFLTYLNYRSPNLGKRLAETLRRWLAGHISLDSEIMVVMMPRREYLRYFARNVDGEYIGTEPEQCWRQGDLDREFGRYQSVPDTKWVVRESAGWVYMEEERSK